MTLPRKIQLLVLAPSVAILLPFGAIGMVAAAFGLLSALDKGLDGRTFAGVLIVGPLLVAVIAVPTLGLYLLVKCIWNSPASVARRPRQAWTTLVVGIASELILIWGALVNRGIQDSTPSIIAPLLFGIPAVIGALNLCLLSLEMARLRLDKEQ